MGVVIAGIGQEVERLTLIEEIPPPVQIKVEKKLREGVRVVLKEGKPGLKQVRYEIIKHGGKEEKKKVGERVLHPPLPRVILMGGGKGPSARGGVSRVREVRQMLATAYCVGDKGVNRWTATGKRTEYGIVAVDPKVIKLGTLLYVEGYGLAFAEDVGGAIKGNRIDLFMKSRAEVRRWGRRLVKVFILE